MSKDSSEHGAKVQLRPYAILSNTTNYTDTRASRTPAGFDANSAFWCSRHQWTPCCSRQFSWSLTIHLSGNERPEHGHHVNKLAPSATNVEGNYCLKVAIFTKITFHGRSRTCKPNEIFSPEPEPIPISPKPEPIS